MGSRSLEKHLGTDQMIDLTFQGVMSAAGWRGGTYTLTFQVVDWGVEDN